MCTSALLDECHSPCQRTCGGQERVIEHWLSSSALCRGRRVSRRHVATTPNNGATKGINDGKESSLTSALICYKANKVACIHYTVCISLRQNTSICACASVAIGELRRRLFRRKLSLLHGIRYWIIDDYVFYF